MSTKVRSYVVFVGTLILLLGGLYVGLVGEKKEENQVEELEVQVFRLEGEKNMRLRSEVPFELFFKFGGEGKEIWGDTEYIIPNQSMLDLESSFLVYSGKIYVFRDWACGTRHVEGDGFDVGSGLGTNCIYKFVLYDPE